MGVPPVAHHEVLIDWLNVLDGTNQLSNESKIILSTVSHETSAIP